MNIRRLQSGGLIVNYTCSSRCGHCLYACGPKREKGYCIAETAESIFNTIKSLGCRSMHIGGGEPMLDIDGLITVLETARHRGVNIEYVETNSSWYKDQESAQEIIARVQNAGLDCFLVSISPFHNEYIPFEKVLGVIAACNQSGMGVFPWMAHFADDIGQLDVKVKHKLEEYAAAFGKSYIPQLRQRYGLTAGGRVFSTFADYQQYYPAEKICKNENGPCSRLTETSHFHIDLYGNYVPGLCAGLSIALEDLGTELSQDKYPILTMLYAKGIPAFYEHAVSQGFKPREKGYSSKCELCTDIRRYLVQKKEVNSPELQPVGFYEELNS